MAFSPPFAWRDIDDMLPGNLGWDSILNALPHHAPVLFLSEGSWILPAAAGKWRLSSSLSAAFPAH